MKANGNLPGRLARFGAAATALALALAASRCTPPAAPTAGADPGAASASAPPSASASAGPVEERAADTMPTLRTGAVAPVERSEVVTAKVRARHLSADAEWVALWVPASAVRSGGRLADSGVTVSAGADTLAFATNLGEAGPPGAGASGTIWLRRPKSSAGQPIEGDLYLPARSEWDEAAGDGQGANRLHPGEHVRFRADAATAADNAGGASGNALLAQWAEAFAAHLDSRVVSAGRSTPWHAFARSRLVALYPPASASKNGPTRPPPIPPVAPSWGPNDGGELGQLMDTTTGMSSVQETLQTHRPVFGAAARQPASIPLASLSAPPLAAHPFAKMVASLGRAVPDEPLAQATPAEFYYLRFSSLSALFGLLDEVDGWATETARLLDGESEDRLLASRYEAELGLARGPLSRALGPSVVDSLAVVGSDPYLREGTDLTVIFRVRNRVLFGAAVASTLAGHGDRHGGLETSRSTYNGVDLVAARSADGAVRQVRGGLDELELVSNSPAAIRRVIDAVRGKRPRLADEPDFQYMLARDADRPADAVGFMGDRFVAEVVGPAQKILEARRQLALAELATPGYAEALFGWIYRRAPASVAELVASKLLVSTELVHTGGERIEWQPGQAARSSWGTPRALTPLIDRPRPARVSAAERAGYEAFARAYQSYWSTYVDPMMLRLSLVPATAGAARSLRAELRILPLIDGTEYREIAEAVGAARVSASPLRSGVRALLGIGREARLRRELSELAGQALPFGRRLDLDFLGEWAMVGLDDRPAVARIASGLAKATPERPYVAGEPVPKRVDEVTLLTRAPAYAAVELRSTAAAAVALVALRKAAESTLPGLVQWGDAESYRDVSIVPVAVRDDQSRRGAHDTAKSTSVYYALCDQALLISLRRETMRWLIDGQLDGTGPRGRGADAHYGQLLFELAGEPRGGLWTVLGWALEQSAVEASARSRAASEVLLEGVPRARTSPEAFRAAALTLFGAVPLTPDENLYTLEPSGVSDPVRGSDYAPRWPVVPVAGSPTEKLLDSVSAFRSELAFDDEGQSASGEPMRSLRVRLSAELRH